jgi:hypothetical protein
MDRLTSMEVLHWVVELGSFSRAADRLDLSKASVTAHCSPGKSPRREASESDNPAVEPDRRRNRLPRPCPPGPRRRAGNRRHAQRRRSVPRGSCADMPALGRGTSFRRRAFRPVPEQRSSRCSRIDALNLVEEASMPRCASVAERLLADRTPRLRGGGRPTRRRIWRCTGAEKPSELDGHNARVSTPYRGRGSDWVEKDGSGSCARPGAGSS